MYKSYAGVFFEGFSMITTFIAFLKNKNINSNEIFKNKKVIVFDLDGTLVDSVNMFNEIYAVLIKKIARKVIDVNQIQEDWDAFAHQNIPGDLYDNFLIYLDKKYSSKLHDLESLRKLYLDVIHSKEKKFMNKIFG